MPQDPLRRLAADAAEASHAPAALLPLAVAAAFAAGTAWGLAAPGAVGISASIAAIAAAAAAIRLASRSRIAALLAAVALAGCGHAAMRAHAAREAAAAMAQPGGRAAADSLLPVRLVARVASPPRSAPAGDRLWGESRRGASLLSVEAILWESRDSPHAAAGRGTLLSVHLRDGPAPLRVGDQIRLQGHLFADEEPANPGSPRRRSLSLDASPLARVAVPEARLIELLPAEERHPPGTLRQDLRWRFESLRAAMRLRAAAILEGMLPARCSGPPRALLEALLLGERGQEEFRTLRDSFAAAGLAHFLAISGFNLAVVAGVAAALASLAGVRPRRQGVAALSAIALYLLVLPAALPVLRAGVMAALLAIGRCLGRRWDSTAATSLAAILLLLAAPGEIERPGFQLSFAAVLALQRLAPRLRRRWFGPRDPFSWSPLAVLRERFASMLSAAVAAWLVSTPIVLCHFGIAATLGVPATLLATPLIAAMVALAAVAMPAAALAPAIGDAAGELLHLLALGSIAIASWVEAIPGSSLAAAPPSAAWGMAATAASALWLALPRGRSLAVASVAMLSLLLWPLRPAHARGDLLVEMLAVGDGTAILLRRGECAAILDAGSGSDHAAGRRTLLPALAALGVRRIEAAFASHPDLDHFSALAEAIPLHRPRRLFVGESFVEAARERPGAAAGFLAMARSHGLVPSVLCEGDSIELLGVRIELLHPPPGSLRRRDNDASLALLVVDLASGIPLLLTCGDLEQEGLAALRQRLGGIDPHAIEVPHHGSATPAAEAFMRSRPRAIWLQSTGPRRLRLDRLGEAAASPLRLATARDGAVRLAFRRDGTLEVESFRGAWRPLLWRRWRPRIAASSPPARSRSACLRLAPAGGAEARRTRRAERPSSRELRATSRRPDGSPPPARAEAGRPPAHGGRGSSPARARRLPPPSEGDARGSIRRRARGRAPGPHRGR